MKKRVWILIVIILLFGGMVSIECYFSASSLNLAVAGVEKKFEANQKEGEEQLNKVPGYLNLLREKALLNSEVQLAKNDSIGLLLQLRDSTAKLVIKGVSVSALKLGEIKISPLFTRLSPEVCYSLLSNPWKVTRAQSTIEREPVNLVYAPKDTTEIAPFVEPDTTHSEPVFFRLSTDQGITLVFYQLENAGDADRKMAFKIALRRRWDRFVELVDAISRGVAPVYQPEIRIGMDKVDAKVLYRALPAYAWITVTF